MTEVETELDSRYDDIDVESILARCQKGPITFSKRCLYQAPEFIKRLPSTEEVEEGTTVSFGCKVVGFPNPTVTWYKDDDVIKTGARAKVDADESGIHSIKIADISKCDAGIYKIRASNLEGSSSSMLYIAVKARSKLRNRKKAKRARLVACPPLFPAIIERVAEEQKAMKEVELQPESPLTPIYCTISRKDPVMWPAFLGDWAYNSDEILHRDEIDDTEEVEDVFDDDDDDVLTPTPTTLTFVSSAYAQMIDNDEHFNDVTVKGNDVTKKGDNNVSDKDCGKCEDRVVQNGTIVDNSKTSNDDKGSKNSEEIGKRHRVQGRRHNDESVTSEHTSRKEIYCDKINNNNKDLQRNKNNDVNINGVGVKSAKDDLPESEQSTYEACNSHQTEVKQRFIDPETVSVISVHRSYAKGDSTSSVARRSPSPLSRSRNPMTFNQNGRNCDMYSSNDTSTLQNMNNERILMKMNRNVPLSSKCLAYLRSIASTNSWEDHLIELFVLLCCGTFLALWFELSPSTFVKDILIALFIKFVLTEVLNDS
ncbi:hypothetical protein ACF0H5_023008 [Mactra antiquata]